jgi:outer membrane receptor for ferrienterochelin and colicins
MRKNFILISFFMTGFLIGSGMARSQISDPPKPVSDEMLLFQEIPSVEGASRYEQLVTQAPSSVTIVSASEIKKMGYRTLAEILEGVRGFFVNYDRKYSYVGVRGFARPGDYNSRVLLLIDEHRINENVFETAFIGNEFPMDIDLIERVEIIRGPGSSIYGSNALLAVINVITRKGKDLRGFEVSGSAGSFDTYEGRASYGNKWENGLEALISGSYYNSQGQNLFFKEFNSPQTNNGLAVNCDYENFYKFFSNFSWHDFNLQGIYSSRDKGIPTGTNGAVFNDDRNQSLQDRSYVDLRYDHRFENDLNFMARAFYDQYRSHDDYVFDHLIYDNPLERVIDRAYTREGWAGTEMQLSKMLFEKHYVTLGYEFRDNFNQDQGSADVNPYYKWFDVAKHSYDMGVYLQDEFRIRKDLILNGGVRYDQYSTFGGTINPRVGLIYMPTGESDFKLLYGTAFRAPSAYEMYYDDGLSQEGNPKLKPEKIETYEVVWEQYFHKYWRLTVSGYYYTISDLISETIDPSNGLEQFQNINSANAKGIEFELDRHWLDKWDTSISYDLQRTTDGQTGSVLPGSPMHLVQFKLIAPLFNEWLFAGTELVWMSSRKTLAGKDAGEHLIGNLTLFSNKLLKNLEVSASVNNIFDQRYSDPGGPANVEDLIEQDGISFHVKFTYRF